MKIPKKVKIKGIEFDVKFEDLGDRAFGDFNELPPLIRLNSKASKEFQEMTFIHEVLHILRDGTEEQWIKEFAWDLWLVLKDNKLLKEK